MSAQLSVPAPAGASPLLSDYIAKPALACELHCTPRTIDRLSLTEGLPFVQVGAKRLFRRSAILRWLEQRETPARPQTKSKRGVR